MRAKKSNARRGASQRLAVQKTLQTHALMALGERGLLLTGAGEAMAVIERIGAGAVCKKINGFAGFPARQRVKQQAAHTRHAGSAARKRISPSGAQRARYCANICSLAVSYTPALPLAKTACRHSHRRTYSQAPQERDAGGSPSNRASSTPASAPSTYAASTCAARAFFLYQNSGRTGAAVGCPTPLKACR